VVVFALIGSTVTVLAKDMAAFLKGQASWIDPNDRPQLLLSRGTVIAWIADPFDLPKSFANHMNSGELVVIPPGTAMVAFPPRKPCSKGLMQRLSQPCPPAPGTDRGSDQRYHLVLTQGGFWGVLDRTSAGSSFVLDENDLKPMADAEHRLQARFLLATTQIVNVPYAVGDAKTVFSRGEVFQRAEPTACSSEQVGSSCVDFNLNSPTFKNSKNRIDDMAKKAGVKPLAAMQVSEQDVIDIQILATIVPEPAFEKWYAGKGGYEEILTGGVFASLRLVSRNAHQARCDTEWWSKTDLASKTGIEVEVGGKLSPGLPAGLDVEAQVKAAVEVAKEKGVKASGKLVIEPELWRIDLMDEDGKSSSFWAGRAKTCGSGGQTRATLMVSNLPPPILEAKGKFLHTNFDQIAEQIVKSGGDAGGVARQVEHLDAAFKQISSSIELGGSPFGSEDGIVRFKCLSQALAFERTVRDKMSDLDPIQVRVAIAVTSAKRGGDIGTTQNLAKFYQDLSCK
jgi:hypothetical protein